MLMHQFFSRYLSGLGTVELRFNESRFLSIYFAVTGVNNILFVIPRNFFILRSVKLRFHCILTRDYREVELKKKRQSIK